MLVLVYHVVVVVLWCWVVLGFVALVYELVWFIVLVLCWVFGWFIGVC